MKKKFPFIKEVKAVLTFDTNFELVVTKAGCRYVSFSDYNRIQDFHEVKRFVIDEHPNIDSNIGMLSIRDKLMKVPQKEISHDIMVQSYITYFYVSSSTTVMSRYGQRLYVVDEILKDKNNLLSGFHVGVDDNTKNPIIMMTDPNLFSDAEYKIVSNILK